MRDLPAAVRAKARDAGAGAWLENLPELVEGLAGRWGLRVGAAFAEATEAYVVSAVRTDGRRAVLKVHVPRPGAAAHEIAFLRLAAGEGCCRLLEYDEPLGALLLERLGPSMADLDLPQPRRLEILCDLATALRRAPAANSDVSPRAGRSLPAVTTRAEHWSRYIPAKWTELGEPCSRRAVDQALAAIASRLRAYDPGRASVAHGDIHQWNALLATPAAATPDSAAAAAAAASRFKLVDPDGLIAEPEFDLGVLMREDPEELLADDPWVRCRWLAVRTGTDPVAIWEWGVADRVATGLTLTIAGVQPVAAQMLAVADAISRAS